MKCSRRKAPMGTTPLRECRRRSRNEVPSPARSGATPDFILGETLLGVMGLAVDATMTAPYVVQCANENVRTKTCELKLMIIVLSGKGSQGVNIWNHLELRMI